MKAPKGYSVGFWSPAVLVLVFAGLVVVEVRFIVLLAYTAYLRLSSMLQGVGILRLGFAAMYGFLVPASATHSRREGLEFRASSWLNTALDTQCCPSRSFHRTRVDRRVLAVWLLRDVESKID